jgi:hypothetical protein
MNKFEELMLKISKVFGLVLMSVTLFCIVIITAVLLFNYGAKIFEKKTPSVSFNKYDFIEASQLPANEAAPESKTKSMAKDAVNELKPLYEKKVDAYIQEKSADLFPKEETRDEKQKEYKNDRMTAFEKTNMEVFDNMIQEFQEKYQKSYIKGLVKYFKEADKEGIEVFTQNKAPITSLGYSRVLYKFNQEFNRELREIKSRDESDSGWQGMIAKSAIYISLFSFITIFLFISVMFAIVRIENKMK